MAFTVSVLDVIAGDKTGLLSKHSSWERVGLSEIAEILNGAPFDSALFSSKEGFPLLRIRDVLGGQTSTYYLGEFDETYVVEQGELVIGMDGDFNSAYWGPVAALLNQRVCKVSPIDEYYSKKLMGYLLPGYLAAINAHTSAVTVKHLSSKTVGEIELPLPPRSEQTRIVEKLEELLSDLDAGVAELNAAQKKLTQYRQSLLKAAVEGTLTAEWRAARKVGAGDTAPETGAQLLARILSERRARWEARQLAKFKEQGKPPPKDWQKKYPEPVAPDTRDLPELPDGWIWAASEQICEFITKGTTPSKDVDDGSQQDIPFLRVTNLTDQGMLDLRDQVFVSERTHRGFLARSVVYPNDVLMNIVGPPLGQVSVVPALRAEWNINQAIAIFRAVDGVLPQFICSFLLSNCAQGWLKARAKTTAGQTNLTLELCRSLPVPLPPTDEQCELVRVLDEMVNAAADQGQAIVVSLKQSAAQRQNILRAAFAGQLVPQDPNDEPASALLERIRAERVEAGKKSPARGRKTKETST